VHPLKVPDGRREPVCRFLTCCSGDAVGFETLVLFDVGGESFKLNCLRVGERN
jgi:hypothetical protein